jgi:hypothetical protein
VSLYQLENGVPMPEPTRHRRAARYPMRDIKVGQSFLIPAKELPKHVGQSVRNCAAYYGKKVSVRRVKGGVRVWRVK